MNTPALDLIETLVKGMSPNSPELQKSYANIFKVAREQTGITGITSLSRLPKLMTDPRVAMFDLEPRLMEVFVMGALCYHAAMEGAEGEFTVTINKMLDEAKAAGLDKVVPLTRKEKA